MEIKIISPAVPQVIGMFRGNTAGLNRSDENSGHADVRRNPVFYNHEAKSGTCGGNLIIDVSTITFHPYGCRTWSGEPISPTGSGSGRTGSNSPYKVMQDIDGRRVYPRAPGSHDRSVPPCGIGRWDGWDFSPGMAVHQPGVELRILEEIRCLKTRCRPGAPSRNGVLLGLIGPGRLPLLLLIVPVAVLFLGSLRPGGDPRGVVRNDKHAGHI